MPRYLSDKTELPAIHRIADRGKTAPVNRRDAKSSQRIEMRCGGIAFVLSEAEARILGIQNGHCPVARHLGEYGCGADRRFCGIALDHQRGAAP